MKKLTFRKLVTNLPFSPNLIHQVSFYARRLKKEEFTRKIGLITTVFALVVQSFVLLAPPQPTLAASGNDILYGGVSNPSQIFNAYDTNRANFKDILSSFGITRDDLLKGHQTIIRYFDYNKQLYSMGRYPYGFSGEYSVKIHNGQTYYMRPLASWGNATDTVWQFQSGNRTFMIMFHCGNLVSIGPSQPEPEQTKDAACTVTTAILNKAIKPNKRFRATFTVTNKSNFNWSVQTGVGKSAFILGTANPNDNLSFGRNREPIPKSADSGNGPLLEAGKTVSWSSNFTAPKTKGDYSFSWRVLQEGVPAQIGTSCATIISVDIPPVCQYNPKLSPGHKDCVPPCEYNKELLSTDKNCVPPCEIDASILSSDPKCTPCEYDSSILASDKRCVPCPPESENSKTNCIILSKDVSNTTQNIDKANGTTANGGDTLVYSLQAHNTGKADQINFIFEDNIGDILEYADVTDLNGAKIDNTTHIISWPPTVLKAGKTKTMTFTVKVKNPIPQTAKSVSNPGTNDLKMTNVYGNTVNIKLAASIPKVTEQIITTLPETGAGLNIVIEASIMMIVTFFYMRSRQLSKEISIVKNGFNYAG